MQDGESIKERDKSKRETIGQAHLFRATRQHGRHVYYSKNNAKKHTYAVRQRNKSKERTQIYNRILQLFTATLKQFYFTDWRHPQTFTQNPKRKGSHDFPVRVVQSSSLDLDSELPPTWSAGSYLAPARVAVQRHERGSGAISARKRGRGNC